MSATFGVVVTAMLIFGSVVPASASTETDQVYSQVNSIRASQGLQALQLNSTLNAAATAWADKLAGGEKGPNGDHHSGYTEADKAIGENVYIGSGEATGAVTAWRTSPGHLANILNAGYTETGIGYNAAGHTWVRFSPVGSRTPPRLTPPPPQLRQRRPLLKRLLQTRRQPLTRQPLIRPLLTK